VVGTYRILPADAAARVGRFYAAGEFDLGRILDLPKLVEVGRACVHPTIAPGWRSVCSRGARTTHQAAAIST